MALTEDAILITDILAIIRTKFNSILTDFADFTFSGGTDLEIDLNVDIVGTLEAASLTTGNGTFTGNVAVAGTLLQGGVAVSLSGHNHDDLYLRDAEIASAYYNKTETDAKYMNLDGSTPITGDIIQKDGVGDQSHSLEQFSEYTDASNYSRSVMKVEDDPYGEPVLSIGVESLGTGTPMTVQKVQNGHIIKELIYNDELADDGTILMPTFLVNMRGWIIAGDNEERADFWVKNDGTVTLSNESVNVVANSGDDAKLCIATVTANPFYIANRLGSAKNIMMMVWYY